jgi:hypothetical protein
MKSAMHRLSVNNADFIPAIEKRIGILVNAREK